ncbi:MAG: VWA domain-containing protein [Porphyromonas sp.]|nr:VWA domain-containing protein [Porphyromonas sp.]
MIEFAYPSFLWGLVALFFLAVFGIGGLLLERRLQLRFAALTTLKRIKPEASGKRKLWQMFFSLLSIAFVLIALAAPRLRESKPSQQKGDLGVDVVFCLDISNSMGAEDLPPNRLVFAKQVVGYCMEKLEGSRVGLVLFAGGAYVRLPLTSDRIIARNMLQDVHQNLLSNQGTNITQALKLGESTLGKPLEAGRAIVLLTDGEDHDGTPLEIAKNIAEKNVRLFTIAVGGTNGVPIPMMDGTVLTDDEGKIVLTKSNPQLCAELAKAGKGKSFTGGSARKIVTELVSELEKLPQANVTSSSHRQYELFVYAAVVALFFLCLSQCISLRKSRLFGKLKLFDR